jgi:hypothetical protein
MIPEGVMSNETIDGASMTLTYLPQDAKIMEGIAGMDTPNSPAQDDPFVLSAEDQESFKADVWRESSEGDVITEKEYFKNIFNMSDDTEVAPLPTGDLVITEGHINKVESFNAEDGTRTFRITDIIYDTYDEDGGGETFYDDDGYKQSYHWDHDLGLPEEGTVVLEEDEWVNEVMEELEEIIIDKWSDESGWCIYGAVIEEIMPAESFETEYSNTQKRYCPTCYKLYGRKTRGADIITNDNGDKTYLFHCGAHKLTVYNYDAESFKEWADEEGDDEEHGDNPTFEEWVDEEIEEHGDVKLSKFKEIEINEPEHYDAEIKTLLMAYVECAYPKNLKEQEILMNDIISGNTNITIEHMKAVVNRTAPKNINWPVWVDEEEEIYEDVEWESEEVAGPKPTTIAALLAIGGLAAYFAPDTVRNFFKAFK